MPQVTSILIHQKHRGEHFAARVFLGRARQLKEDCRQGGAADDLLQDVLLGRGESQLSIRSRFPLLKLSQDGAVLLSDPDDHERRDEIQGDAGGIELCEMGRPGQPKGRRETKRCGEEGGADTGEDCGDQDGREEGGIGRNLRIDVSKSRPERGGRSRGGYSQPVSFPTHRLDRQCWKTREYPASGRRHGTHPHVVVELGIYQLSTNVHQPHQVPAHLAIN
jgi:hypothetical protein